jgi:serine protease Do
MSIRKSSFFYGTLIALASLVSGMVIASRLDLAPSSFASTLSVPATNSAPITGVIDATTFRTIAHDQSPAVVSILVTGKRAAVTQDLSDLFGFGLPGGQGQRRPRSGSGGNGRSQIVQGAGSGFIIDGKSGYILTNNHVIEDADNITVQLSNMQKGDDGLKAKLVGHDKLTDSALLQLVDVPKGLPEVKFGDSTQIAAGDWVMAIGNPFTFSNTVTVGVVSAVGRVDPELNPVLGRSLEYIQTDAAINKGNSGGPLLNIRGEVVGMNTAIISESGGNVGIGFAVPINTIRNVLPQLQAGKVVRGRIGVQVDPRTMTSEVAKSFGLSSPGGAIISGVEDGAPAKAAGIKVGDVITEFNGKVVKDSSDLVALVSATAPGTSVPVKVFRDGKPVSLSVKIGELNTDPEETAAVNDNGRRLLPPGSAGRVAPADPFDTGLGMSIEDVTPRVSRNLPGGKGGAVVADVEPLSDAYRSGMAPGDVILSINGHEVSSVDEVSKALKALTNGQVARVVVWRSNGNGPGDEQLILFRKR